MSNNNNNNNANQQQVPRTHRQVSVAEMRAAVIGGTTYNGYKYELWRILEHGCKPTNHARLGWITAQARDKFFFINNAIESATGRTAKAKAKWDGLKQMLEDCHNNPILNIDCVTPESYMDFLQSQRDNNGAFLSSRAYKSKSSALFHLFRCHPGLEGYPPGFKEALKTLMCGFTRTVVSARNDEGEAVDDGKKPMSHELYCKLAEWFFQMGTAEGIFGLCFLVLTWNLMCRANNTVRICFPHISWQWDSLVIHFAQQKGDQMGLTDKYPRHLYANPYNPLVSPIFVLALYLCTFGASAEPNGRLFPGREQYKRFSDLMERVLKDHEAEVIAMGYASLKDIGTHSIRKGATKWLSGQPGGPSSMSICIRGGWSLGGVKDVYMTYEAEGDHFCGRMLSLLPLLQAKFAASPPSFSHGSVTLEDVHLAVAAVFTAFDGRGPLAAVLNKGLASLAYHKDTVLALPMDHHCRSVVALYQDATMLENMSADVKVLHPWETQPGEGLRFGSGIPPHVALLVSQQVVIRNLETFVSNFDQRMHRIFDERNVNGGISIARMQEIVGNVNNDLRGAIREDIAAEIRRYGLGGGVAPQPPNRANGNRQGDATASYALHYYDGRFHKVPKEWRLPKGTLKHIWIAFNVGDTVNNIPPLRTLSALDVKHLDDLPVPPGGNKRRPARKTLSDMNFVCKHIQRKAEEAGQFEARMTREQLGDCLDAIATVDNGLLSSNARKTHIQWQTAVRTIRKAVKAAQNNTQT